MLINQPKLPNIKSSAKLRQHPNHNESVNSYNFMKSQWMDINILTNDRRSFVRDFAKRQIEPSPLHERLQ